MFPATFTRRLWPQDTSGQHLAHGPAAQTMRAKRRSAQGPGMMDTRAGELRPIHPLRRTGPPPCYLAVSPLAHPITQSCKGTSPPQTGGRAHSIVTRILGSGKPITTHVYLLVHFPLFLFGCVEWHMGSWFPDQGLSPRSLQWRCRVLTTEWSGKPLPLGFKHSARKHKSHWRQGLSHCLPTAPRTLGIP